ncbi:MAG: CRISPR-associated endonuclease Cas1 [Firmicutes bacterium]|nr:CRISPR-associated endonuclease Cas1 [Bacillota bacterium]
MPEHLIIESYGSFFGKKSERLQIKEKGEVVREIPFFEVEQVTIAGSGVTLSTDAIYECIESGIQINFLTNTGKPYAKIMSPTNSGTVKTQREQLLGYFDHRGLLASKAFVEGKISNQINTLKYFARHRKQTQQEVYEKMSEAVAGMEKIRGELEGLQGDSIDEKRPQLMSMEGRAANLYWEGVAAILGDKIDFSGREHRGTQDPVNSLLNYGYGMLYQQVWGSVILAGLEPFAGFLHVDRPGKPSLVLDMVEEFRSPVVDRTILAMLSKGFTPKMDEDRLDQGTRKELAGKILERLSGEERFEGKKHRLKTVIQMQARHLATFLRGEGRYKPFVASW